MNMLSNPDMLARRAGFLYLLLVPLGIFGLIYVPDMILVDGDPQATFLNIVANEQTFRWSIIAAFAIQVIQLFVAISLYDLFKPINQRMAAYIVLFTLAAMPIAMLNELSHVAVLYLVNSQDIATTFSAEQIQQWVAFLLNLNSDGIMIAHVFWGLWLFPMGYLAAKSGFAPKFIGWLLMLSCVGYVADTFIWMLAPDSTFSVANYLGWSEILLPTWLLVRGLKTEKWAQWQTNSLLPSAT